MIGESIRARQDVAASPANVAFVWPMWRHRRITSGFGQRKHPLLGLPAPHLGIDIAAATGTPVRSIGDGAVILRRELPTYGRIVAVAHGDSLVSLYAHLASVAVREGDRVRSGAIIGRVGHSGRVTGPHLHFEVWQNGNAIDPLSVFGPSSRHVVDVE